MIKYAFDLLTHLKPKNMNLPKFLKIALFVICIGSTSPAVSNTISPQTKSNSDSSKNANKTNDPLVRLQEIKDMNKENLSRAQKKDLRKEVKEIRKEIRTSKNGIYLSVGAIIIVVLLLILLL